MLNQKLFLKMQVYKKILLVVFFATAMAWLESAVVVYLRMLYYPDGFKFPLINFPKDISFTEIIREAATIIMLWCVAAMNAKRAAERFGYFLIAFAIWDIFYYVFLKVIINWPISFFETDILFLIPVPWIGPVLAPVLFSVGMIIFAIQIIRASSVGVKIIFDKKSIAMLLLGCVTILFSFLKDWNSFFTTKLTVENIVLPSYNWLIFTLGTLPLLITMWILQKKTQTVLGNFSNENDKIRSGKILK